MTAALWLLALTIWGEARDAGPTGMRAVGHVVMNRAKHEPIATVVWKRRQFHCWQDHNRTAMRGIAQLPANHPDRLRWDEAKRIAARIMAGRDRDLTRGAVSFHSVGRRIVVGAV